MTIEKVKCPYCNREMSTVMYDKGAVCEKVYIRCKNKKCKKTFEIIINKSST